MATGETAGQRIKRARLEAGLSQDGLAAKMGSTRQMVIQWEKDRHKPRASTRRRLANATGKDASFFESEDDKEED
ncbi:MAG: helix-turn-helix transcriptional regulator [Haloechinothrix sp.]